MKLRWLWPFEARLTLNQVTDTHVTSYDIKKYSWNSACMLHIIGMFTHHYTSYKIQCRWWASRNWGWASRFFWLQARGIVSQKKICSPLHRNYFVNSFLNGGGRRNCARRLFGTQMTNVNTVSNKNSCLMQVATCLPWCALQNFNLLTFFRLIHLHIMHEIYCL